ncbi:putative ABC transport system permease protein [Mucilaginibacter yixingensis]|uniref:Putative ABC transport system permease protein n=1 Tax=Mucilaginibacter yixingensis TaxID=1295612 RepID=A0A2T5J6Y3_9SPHI|nr:ABC transporter permease [Mucilaginibacter yixingensis]PTQ94915.1 putative ABC transport system permease protein [Mucilaginibacter yixingensis]
MGFYLSALIMGLCLSMLALGIFISMKIFNIPDITTDGSYTLGGAVTAVMFMHQQNIWLVLLAVAASGAIAGALTGLIHTKLKINALLAGILVMTALYSVNLIIMQRSNIPLTDASKLLFGLIHISKVDDQNTLLIVLLFVVAATLIIGYLLKTDFGVAMRATGNSESMVRALGVNTDRMKIIGLALANALTALSGFLVTQFQLFADISMGIGVVIVGLGSVIIAETVINWLRITSVWASLALVLAGAIIFQFVLAFTLSIGIDANYLKMVTAAFVLLIVSLPRITLRGRAA